MQETHAQIIEKIDLILSRGFFDYIKTQPTVPAGVLATLAKEHFTQLGHPYLRPDNPVREPIEITGDDVIRARKIQMGVIVHDRYVVMFHWFTAFRPFIHANYPHVVEDDFDAFKTWAVQNNITTYFQDDPTHVVDMEHVREIFTAIRDVIVKDNT